MNKRKIKRTNSQRWHRDRDDVKILKIFLYLNDISIKNGATEYIPYSRKNEKYHNTVHHHRIECVCNIFVCCVVEDLLSIESEMRMCVNQLFLLLDLHTLHHKNTYLLPK